MVCTWRPYQTMMKNRSWKSSEQVPICFFPEIVPKAVLPTSWKGVLFVMIVKELLTAFKLFLDEITTYIYIYIYIYRERERALACDLYPPPLGCQNGVESTSWHRPWGLEFLPPLGCPEGKDPEVSGVIFLLLLIRNSQGEGGGMILRSREWFSYCFC